MVAQLVEQRSPKPQVAGSSPVRPAQIASIDDCTPALRLKKVTTPTGRELLGYFLAVLLFVVVMLLLISGLDYLFGQGAFWIFGNGTIQRN